ncbi:zf-DHHC-domain-containing protein [Morchella conica CCBAS932]|uniref:Palmitoyltransferase n=1 Tax=Morchella conica CCBAS932 TaxID=1392247 RepID=A0A3N4KG88_9PEZI|nr:zf-DHHC-domain-containing protein [Morchella conica CCBAS932]
MATEVTGRVKRGNGKHAMNRWVAAFMPFVMAGLAGYATWVLVVLICIKYLILSEHRTAAGAVTIALYFFFFLPFVAAYLRVLWTITVAPGFVARGQDPNEAIKNEKLGVSDSDAEMGLGSARIEHGSFGNRDGVVTENTIPELNITPPPPVAQPGRQASETPIANSYTLTPPVTHQSQAQANDRPTTSSSTLHGHSYDAFDAESRAELPEPENCMDFYGKDVYVCEPNGRPKWCYHCNCYKPDRSHHCSEIDRCVYKMDHFCPWVGGIVAESSYKFFFQVVVYGAFYCLYLIISLAYFIHEHKENHGGSVDTNWLVALGLSCLFGLFSCGMAISTTQLIYRNLSTVDSLSHTVKVYQLAIHDPNPPPAPGPGGRPLVYRVYLPEHPKEGQEPRCFAIVNTKQGENPWRLDNMLDNFREVLGYSIWDWWLPIKQSPLVKKNNGRTWYKMNEKLIERLKMEAGIETGTTENV